MWPIEERPVAKGDVPGEWYAPTQPFVTKPPAFDRQGVSIDDLIDFTPELRAEAVELVSRYKIGPIFTPPVVSKWEGPLATLMLPSSDGRAELAGRRARSGDQHPLHLLVLATRRRLAWSAIRRDPTWLHSGPRARSERAAAGPGGARRFARCRAVKAAPAITVQGLPLVKPPYGRITAIDLNKGDDRLADRARRHAGRHQESIRRSRA